MGRVGGTGTGTALRVHPGAPPGAAPTWDAATAPPASAVPSPAVTVPVPPQSRRDVRAAALASSSGVVHDSDTATSDTGSGFVVHNPLAAPAKLANRTLRARAMAQLGEHTDG